MPRHLWAGISASNFPLAQYNLKPIGSGPYKFKEFNKNEDGNIESMKFVYNENYYLTEGPFIKKLNIFFLFRLLVITKRILKCILETLPNFLDSSMLLL